MSDALSVDRLLPLRHARKAAEKLLAEEDQRRAARRARSKLGALAPHIAALRAGPAVDRVEYILTTRRRAPVKVDATQRRWFAFVELAHWLGLHALLLAPRGSGKTSLLVVGKTADDIGRDPDGSLQIASVAAPTARKRVGAIKRMIATSERYRELYPNVLPDPDDWSKTEIRVAGTTSTDPSLIGFGVTSESVGSRSTGLTLDDVDGRKSLSATVRETIRDTLDSQVMPTLEVGALATMVATAWHEEDYAHTKLRERDWACLVDGVSDDLDWIEYVTLWGGKALDVDLGGEVCEPTAWGLKRFVRDFGCVVRRMPMYAHFDRAELLKRRGDGEQPRRSFRRGYQQDAYTDEERWFPSFELVPKYGHSYDVIPGWSGWAYITGVDLSSKKRPGNAVVTAGLAPNGKRVIVDVRIGAWSGPDLLRELAKVDANFRPTAIFVESNAYQETFADFARDKPEYFSLSSRLRDYQTPGTVHTDEYLGIKFLDEEFKRLEWMQLVPHEKKTGCDCGHCELIRQVTQHPHAKQRDALMALWFCREGFRLMGAKVEIINRNESRAGARDHRAL